jgi:hypothetical protein
MGTLSVLLKEPLGVGRGVGVGVDVGVGVLVGMGVLVIVGVSTGVGVGVEVDVDVDVGVLVCVSVGVSEGEGAGVAVSGVRGVAVSVLVADCRVFRMPINGFSVGVGSMVGEFDADTCATLLRRPAAAVPRPTPRVDKTMINSSKRPTQLMPSGILLFGPRCPV